MKNNENKIRVRGGGGGVGSWVGLGGGGQVGYERRIEVFVKFRGGGVRVDVNGEVKFL